jgi:hypothetical protein
MKSTTFTFTVSGDNYEELIRSADAAIARFMSSSHDEDFEDEDGSEDYKNDVRVNYELVVTANSDIASDYEYTGEVVAKLRDK